MVVESYSGSLDCLVGADLHLFAGLSYLLNDLVGNGQTVHRELAELFGSFDFVVEGEFQDSLCEVYETLVLGYEVGLALQGEHSGKVAVGSCEHAAFGLTVFALGSDSLTFLTEDFNSGIDVAVSFGKGFLAVHQAGAGEVAQLGDFSHCYSHLYIVFWRS